MTLWHTFSCHEILSNHYLGTLSDSIMYFLTSWHTFDIRFYDITYFPYFLTSLPFGLKKLFSYFLMLWCTFWCYDVLFDVMMYFLMLWCTFWCYDVLFDVMMYFLMLWCTLWCYDVLCDVMMYFLMLWCTFWCYDVLFDVMMYFLMLWCTFWCDEVLFDVIAYFWLHDVLLDIMTLCRQDVWRHDVLLWCYDVCFNYDIVFDVMRYRFDVMTYFLTSSHTFNMKSTTIHAFLFKK